MKMFKAFNFLLIILIAVACKDTPLKKAEPKQVEVKKMPADLVESTTIKKPEQKVLMSSKKVVTEILITSPRYKELTRGLHEAIIRNGGLSFGLNLEGSPNPKIDTVCCYSNNYDFSVFESYSDRQLSTVRFSFNPDNKQLYEYDAVHDQLKPIDFDKKLLVKYELSCK